MPYFFTFREVALACLAFFTSLLGTRIMIAINIQGTSNPRSSHTNPTPKAGGLGIVVGFFLAVFLMGMKSFPFYSTLILWIGTFGLAGVMTLMGLADDIWGLPYQLRLILQILTAFWLIQLGASNPWGGIKEEILWGNTLISFLWLMTFPNAFKEMDQIPGLSASTTITTSFFLSLISYKAGNLMIAFTSLVLCASTLGFIVFNYPRARIFMGDTGNLFIGFLFAAYALIGFNSEIDVIPLWTVPLLFFFQLYDVIITRFRSLFLGRSFFTVRNEHLFQLLNRAGWSHARVSFLYCSLTCLQGLGALSLPLIIPNHQVLLFLPYLLSAILLQRFIFKKARREKVTF